MKLFVTTWLSSNGYIDGWHLSTTLDNANVHIRECREYMAKCEQIAWDNGTWDDETFHPQTTCVETYGEFYNALYNLHGHFIAIHPQLLCDATTDDDHVDLMSSTPLRSLDLSRVRQYLR